MKPILFFLLTTIVLITCGCEADTVDYGWGAFRVDLATCEVVDEQAQFVTDNGVRLIPVIPVSATASYTGKRFLLNYVSAPDTIEGRCKITLNSLSRINSQPVKQYSVEEVAQMDDAPIQLISAWYAGGYINLRLKIEVNQTLHGLRVVSTDVPKGYPIGSLYLELHHDNGGDTPGYYASAYQSFRVEHLLTPDTRQLFLSINSDNYGRKVMRFDIPKKP